MNDYQKQRFSRRILECLFNTIKGKRLAIFGFAFKANTGDTRESPAIYVCRDLLKEQAELSIYDPKVDPKQIIADLGRVLPDMGQQLIDKVRIIPDPYEAAKSSHALVVCTEWNEFKTYDYKKMYDTMMKPAWIFDGRMILDGKRLQSIGFHVEAIGKSFKRPSFITRSFVEN